MNAFKTKLVTAAVFAAGLLAGPAMADPDPQMYCDCVARCAKLHPGGGIPLATCLYNCDQAYGPAICPDAMTDMPQDRR